MQVCKTCVADARTPAPHAPAQIAPPNCSYNEGWSKLQDGTIREMPVSTIRELPALRAALQTLRAYYAVPPLIDFPRHYAIMNRAHARACSLTFEKGPPSLKLWRDKSAVAKVRTDERCTVRTTRRCTASGAARCATMARQGKRK